MLRVPSKLTPELEKLVTRTIGCCIAVHRALGPGLVEPAYNRAVGYELEAQQIPYERERPATIFSRGKRVYQHRLELVVGGQILLELKAVNRLHPVHQAQALSCLRISKLPIALLVNFNVPVLPQGLKRLVL